MFFYHALTRQLQKIISHGYINYSIRTILCLSIKPLKFNDTIHQHLLCLCIKEIQKQSYRDCRDFLDEFDNLQEALGLTQVPHYTTPQKCLQRFPPRWYRFLLRQLTLVVKSRASAVIDGFQSKALTQNLQKDSKKEWLDVNYHWLKPVAWNQEIE